MSQNIFPFKPTKNTAFTPILTFEGTSRNDTPPSITSSAISKDGGQFVALTNAPTLITNQIGLGISITFFYRFSIALTAAEMNADIVSIRFMSSTSEIAYTTFYTTTDSGGGGSVDFDLDDIKKAVNSAVIKFTR